MALRRIKAIDISRGPTPSVLPGAAPVFEWVDPRELFVDEAYQRSLGEKGLGLIRRIVGAFGWARYRPPVVVRSPEGYEVIDGQHTATAAASSPLIDKIPVMVVEASDQAARAGAFVSLNRARTNLTPMQLHYASVVAGDEEALKVAKVCAGAGVRILKTPPAKNQYSVGDLVSVAAVGRLLQTRTEDDAIRVLSILVRGGCAPVSIEGIKAVDALLFSPEYRGEVRASDIIRELSQMADPIGRAKREAAELGIPTWKGLVLVLYRRIENARAA